MAGRTLDLKNGRVEALQALFSSLSTGEGASTGAPSRDQVKNLAEKLDVFLGEGSASSALGSNEVGEPVNEDGLPIIEISEPVGETSERAATTEASLFDEQDLIPLSNLSRQERLRLRSRRDRILDELEAEEEQEALEAAEREHQQNVEELVKRAEALQAEKSRRLAAKEMQKKLGKALLKNIVEARQREELALSETESAMNSPVARSSDYTGKKVVKPKKSVSFADPPSEDDLSSSKPAKKRASLAWGDVSIGALRARQPKVRLKSDEDDSAPMRMEVVERVPGEKRTLGTQNRDSDDESLPDESTDRHSSSHISGDHVDFGEGSDSANDRYLKGGTDIDEDEEGADFDLSQAQLQREIALEYIRLRETIGAEAAQAMTSYSHVGEDDWDQPEVPLEATLARSPPKSGVSRFKETLQTNRLGISSISLESSVLPKEQAQKLRRIIREGKLADDKLIGAEESESEDDAGGNRQRMLEMLKNGEVVTGNPLVDGTAELEAAKSSEHTQGAQKLEKAASQTFKTSKFFAGRLSSQPSPPDLAPREPLQPRVGNEVPAKSSRFMSGRSVPQSQPLTTDVPHANSAAPTAAGKHSDASALAPMSKLIKERAPTVPLAQSSETVAAAGGSANDNGSKSVFKKPPTVISVPSHSPATIQ